MLKYRLEAKFGKKVWNTKNPNEKKILQHVSVEKMKKRQKRQLCVTKKTKKSLKWRQNVSGHCQDKEFDDFEDLEKLKEKKNDKKGGAKKINVRNR